MKLKDAMLRDVQYLGDQILQSGAQQHSTVQLRHSICKLVSTKQVVSTRCAEQFEDQLSGCRQLQVCAGCLKR